MATLTKHKKTNTAYNLSTKETNFILGPTNYQRPKVLNFADK